MFEGIIGISIGLIILIIVGMIMMLAKFYRKVDQGQALVRNGLGGTHVSFSGIMVIPVLHKAEVIDISVKRIVIDRHDEEGLICKDNMRADIKVAFFVRVNKTEDDVLKVAQSIGCARASRQDDIQHLFEAKFSEALKTVGKQFDFVGLYNSREQFKEEILKIIGTDLNGFVLDDAAIDFLEQTHLEKLDPKNILDAEGIKKITQLTSEQLIQANEIDQEREKTITKQNVESKEAILALQRQQEEAEARQKREIESIKAREESETQKIKEEERLKAARARITTEEEIHVAEENKDRQIIVAKRNKERTDAIESERVEKDRQLEINERERIVELAQIEKQKALELEQKNIQNVIRERVTVEKTVIEEQERMKDIEAFAQADRDKRVAITLAEKEAEEDLVKSVKAAEASRKVAELKADEQQVTVIKAAEASKQASQLKADEKIIEADAFHTASEKQATAKKTLANATIDENAAIGLAEARVLTAKAEAFEKQGASEAKVQSMKFQAEAKGIENKANAMKLLDSVSRAHEEFRLQLSQQKEIALAQFSTQKDIANYHSSILSQALQTANIDIIGGETTFFERVVNAVSTSKSIDRLVNHSQVLSDVKETFFNTDPDFFKSQLTQFITQFQLNTDDLKNLSVSAAVLKLVSNASSSDMKSQLYQLLAQAERSGIADKMIHTLMTQGK